MNKLASFAIALMVATCVYGATDYARYDNTTGKLSSGAGATDLFNIAISPDSIDQSKMTAYGALSISASPLYVPDSVTVTDGTIDSGTVTNTRTVDGIFLDVQESGVWKLDFTFTNMTAHPHLFYFQGYYAGKTADEVKIKTWDWKNTTWSNFTSVADDLPKSSINKEYIWEFPEPHTNMYEGGICSVRVDKITAATAASHLFTDRAAILPAQLHMVTAGVWYAVGDFDCEELSNVVCNASNGTIRPLLTGMWEWNCGGSGTGDGGVTFNSRMTTNYIDTGYGFSQYIGFTGKVFNARSSGLVRVNDTNTVFRWQLSADKSDTFATFIKYSTIGRWIGK